MIILLWTLLRFPFMPMQERAIWRAGLREIFGQAFAFYAVSRDIAWAAGPARGQRWIKFGQRMIGKHLRYPFFMRDRVEFMAAMLGLLRRRPSLSRWQIARSLRRWCRLHRDLGPLSDVHRQLQPPGCQPPLVREPWETIHV